MSMIVRRALLVLCLALFPVASFAVVGADMGVTGFARSGGAERQHHLHGSRD